MARSSKPATTAPKVDLSIADMEAGVIRLQKRLDELNAFDPRQMRVEHPPELNTLGTSIKRALEKTFGENTSDYNRYASAGNLAWSPVAFTIGQRTPLHEYQEGVERKVANARSLLSGAIKNLEEDIAEAQAAAPAPRVTTPGPGPSRSAAKKVFVVHGHDDAAKHELARFLERVELEAVILHEQPNQGRSIIEKFIECAGDVAFAVVLFTPDDLGGAQAAPMQGHRARQNVVFELGYFVAKLGRGKVCLLRKGDVEIPSDLYGVIYTELDANEGWKLALVKELKAAGLAFDANRVWG